MSTFDTTFIPTPAKPAPKLMNLFCVRFKSRGVMSEKMFLFEGRLMEATARAKRHCEIQGYHHIWTSSAISDLDTEDNRIYKGEEHKL